MHVANLPPSLISSSTPFSHNRSFSNDESALEVVVDRKWSWSNVIDNEEFVGRMSFVSRLPQYLVVDWLSLQHIVHATHLMQAMLTGAEAVAWYTDILV